MSKTHHPLLVAAALSLTFLPGTNLFSAEPLEPGAVRSFDVTASGKKVPFRFRYCPPGELIPGRPGVGDAKPVAMEAFHLMEGEFTVGQFGALLPDRLPKIQKLAGPHLQNFITNEKMPVFGVSFDDIQKVSRAIEKHFDHSSDVNRPLVERWQVRLPTHYEWQYACRAKQTPSEAVKTPHFYRWVDYRALDKNTVGSCKDEWEKMGRADPFLGTQEQVVELISNRSKGNNTVPQEILREFFKAALGVDRDLAQVPDPLRLLASGSTKPNGWNIFEMHTNVSEWVMTSENQAAAREFWSKLDVPSQADSLRNQPLFFFAGGGFNQNAAGSNGWTRFTAWGGYSEELEGQPVGLEVATGKVASLTWNEVDETDLVYEFNPGFRLVIQRSIRSDWFAEIRKAAFASELAAFQQQLEKCRDSLAELQPLEQEKITATMNYYEAIAAGRSGDAAKVNDLLSKIDPAGLGDDAAFFQELSKVVGNAPEAQPNE
ncbi:MAG: SUMF1/EgtB/PvdO family nonheme iron enzyme [Planctomycetales bacterium]